MLPLDMFVAKLANFSMFISVYLERPIKHKHCFWLLFFFSFFFEFEIEIKAIYTYNSTRTVTKNTKF